MKDIWPIMLAVLSANILTVTFFYGLKRAFNIYEGDKLDLTTACALLLPLFFIAGGFYLYG